MAEFIIIIALIIAICLFFRSVFVSEGHCKIANASVGSFTEVFRLFQLENILDLVYGFVTHF